MIVHCNKYTFNSRLLQLFKKEKSRILNKEKEIVRKWDVQMDVWCRSMSDTHLYGWRLGLRFHWAVIWRQLWLKPQRLKNNNSTISLDHIKSYCIWASCQGNICSFYLVHLDILKETKTEKKWTKTIQTYLKNKNITTTKIKLKLKAIILSKSMLTCTPIHCIGW